MKPGDLCAGRFELERLVRATAPGAVWRARDREGGATVELSVHSAAGSPSPGSVHAGPGDDAAWIERATTVEAIEHEAIPRVVARGVEPDGLRYVATEWVEGDDLGRRLARGSLTVDESLRLAARTAEALAAAHARGIVHGGVSPAALVLPGGDPGQAKLLGLGDGWAPAAALVTASGLAPGGPVYISPEQAQGGRADDPRVDIFGLGCVLYECLTGMPAFNGTYALAALAKLLLSSPPPVGRLCNDVPAPIEALVNRMLAKSPEGRPSGCAEVIGIVRDVERRRAPVVEHAYLEAPGSGLGEDRVSEAELLQAPPLQSKHIWLVIALAPAAEADGDAEPFSLRTAAVADDYNASVHHLFDGSCLIRIDPERSPGGGDPPSTPGEALELRRNAVLLNRLRRARIQALGGERAARCALTVRGALRGAPMVLTMTPRSRPGEWLSGQSIEWATKLLDGGLRASLQGIVMDKESADLLRAELFNVTGTGDLLELRGEWTGQGA